MENSSEDLLHTCSSDEQLRTGEVTLENPMFMNNENNQPTKWKGNKNLKTHSNKENLKKTIIDKQSQKIPNFLCQPFNNISNIRETD